MAGLVKKNHGVKHREHEEHSRSLRDGMHRQHGEYWQTRSLVAAVRILPDVGGETGRS